MVSVIIGPNNFSNAQFMIYSLITSLSGDVNGLLMRKLPGGMKIILTFGRFSPEPYFATVIFNVMKAGFNFKLFELLLSHCSYSLVRIQKSSLNLCT